jgi:hypothetical protein
MAPAGPLTPGNVFMLDGTHRPRGAETLLVWDSEESNKVVTRLHTGDTFMLVRTYMSCGRPRWDVLVGGQMGTFSPSPTERDSLRLVSQVGG